MFAHQPPPIDWFIASHRPTLWYDMQRTTVVDGKASVLNDRSVNGKTITQTEPTLRGESTDQPGYGKATVFTGTQYYQLTNVTISPAAYKNSIIFVAKDTGGTYNGVLYSWGSPPDGQWGTLIVEFGKADLSITRGIHANCYDGTPVYPQGDIHIYTASQADAVRADAVTWDSALNPDLLKITTKEGTIIAESAAGNTVTIMGSIARTLSVGARVNTTKPLKGLVFEIAHFSGATATLTTERVNALCRALAYKHGAT